MNFDIAFVILTWNSSRVIENCLNSLAAFEKLRVLVCVVENGSTDGTLTLLSKIKTDLLGKLCIEIIELPYNVGTTISRNRGIKAVASRARFLCVLDSDTEVNEEAFEEMISVCEKNPQIGIIGPAMHNKDGLYQNSGRSVPTLTEKIIKVMPFDFLRRRGEAMEKIPSHNASIYTVGYLMSACWLMPMSVAEDLGEMDEKIFYAPEDVEYCLRAWQAGYWIVYDKQADIVHLWQRLSRKRLFSRHNWEHIKGLIYLFYKYGYMFRSPLGNNLGKKVTK